MQISKRISSTRCHLKKTHPETNSQCSGYGPGKWAACSYLQMEAIVVNDMIIRLREDDHAQSN
jgi:hypothetical protein